MLFLIDLRKAQRFTTALRRHSQTDCLAKSNMKLFKNLAFAVIALCLVKFLAILTI